MIVQQTAILIKRRHALYICHQASFIKVNWLVLVEKKYLIPYERKKTALVPYADKESLYQPQSGTKRWNDVNVERTSFQS